MSSLDELDNMNRKFDMDVDHSGPEALQEGLDKVRNSWTSPLPSLKHETRCPKIPPNDAKSLYANQRAGVPARKDEGNLDALSDIDVPMSDRYYSSFHEEVPVTVSDGDDQDKTEKNGKKDKEDKNKSVADHGDGLEVNTDEPDLEMTEPPTVDRYSLDDDNPEEPEHHFPHTTRSVVRSFAFSSIIDDDDSGTYNPRAQSVTTTRSEPKPSRKDGEDNSCYQLRLRANKLGHAASRINGESLVVTFRVTSEEFRRRVAQIPDNWAPLEWNVLADEHENLASVSGLDGCTSSKSYRLRKRADSDPDNSGASSSHVRIPDPAGIEEDLYGHPEARGCVACRKLILHNPHLKCPLLEDDATWPCDFCRDDEIDCVLITTPQFKSTCQRCKKRKLPCSYRSLQTDSTVPCYECQAAGDYCIAGPAAGASRERISYDKDYSRKPERRYIQCTSCRQDHKACSLKSKADEPPCKRCVKQGFGGTFEPLPRAKKPSKLEEVPKSAVEEKGVSSPTAAAPDVALGKTELLQPPTRATITTALCHPIAFMVENSRKCHWCASASYGAFGNGWRDVLVKPFADGSGYTELENGHSNDNPPTAFSRMCLSCCVWRLRIIACDDHELAPIEGLIRPKAKEADGAAEPDEEIELELNTAALDVDAMFDRLLDNAPLTSDKWCALCPSPALYRCCTPQATDMWGDAIVDPASPEASGCGLLLCEDCAFAYDDEGAGLAEVLDVIGRDVEHEVWGLGVRADADLLRSDGLLVKNVLEA